TGNLTLTLDVDTDTKGANVTTVNASKFTGIDSYVIRDTDSVGGVDNASLFNIASGTSVRLADDLAAVTFTVLGSAAGSEDSISLNLQNRATTATDVDVTSVTANNVETIN